MSRAETAIDSKQSEEKCPCGTGRSYGGCCGRWHAGERGANPEELMRSRYSAFVLRNETYLRATWHRSHRPRKVEFDVSQVWLSLSVIDAQVCSADSAEVEFIARSRTGNARVLSHHERSSFIREGSQWFYVEGLLS